MRLCIWGGAIYTYYLEIQTSMQTSEETGERVKSGCSGGKRGRNQLLGVRSLAFISKFVYYLNKIIK